MSVVDRKPTFVAAVLLVALASACEAEVPEPEAETDVEYMPPVIEVGDPVVQAFRQDVPNQLDVLLVIDDSCSMEPYQEVLGNSFEPFVSWFERSDIDYAISTTTTSFAAWDGSKRIMPPITPTTPDAAEEFRRQINVGTNGSGYEVGIESAVEAWLDLDERGVARPDAELAIVFVSDEQDSSPKPVADYLNTFGELIGWRGRFNASAFVAVDLDQCNELAGSRAGTRYVEFVDYTDGVTVDLCEAYAGGDAAAFRALVPEVSRASARLKREFRLSAIPVLDTLTVEVDDAPQRCGEAWTLRHDEADDGWFVRFRETAVPLDGSRIVIRFEAGDDPPVGGCPNDGG